MRLIDFFGRANLAASRQGPASAAPSLPQVGPAWWHKDMPSFERACRQAVQIASVEPDVWLARVLGCQKMLLSKRDLHVAAHLAFDGFWEAWVSLAMIRTVQPGWRCVDLGANAGYFTLLLAQLCGATGHVWAVEPDQLLSRLLRLTIQLNGLDWVDTFAGVIADRQGEFTLRIPQDAVCRASIVRQTDGDRVTVPGQALDHLCQGERVDFIKIDVEDAEELVWQGMQQVLDDNPTITIFMEFGASRYRDAWAFLAAIQAKGFSLEFIDVDATIKVITPAQLIRHPDEVVMLCLRRGG